MDSEIRTVACGERGRGGLASGLWGEEGNSLLFFLCLGLFLGEGGKEEEGEGEGDGFCKLNTDRT